MERPRHWFVEIPTPPLHIFYFGEIRIDASSASEKIAVLAIVLALEIMLHSFKKQTDNLFSKPAKQSQEEEQDSGTKEEKEKVDSINLAKKGKLCHKCLGIHPSSVSSILCYARSLFVALLCWFPSSLEWALGFCPFSFCCFGFKFVLWKLWHQSIVHITSELNVSGVVIQSSLCSRLCPSES